MNPNANETVHEHQLRLEKEMKNWDGAKYKQWGAIVTLLRGIFCAREYDPRFCGFTESGEAVISLSKTSIKITGTPDDLIDLLKRLPWQSPDV